MDKAINHFIWRCRKHKHEVVGMWPDNRTDHREGSYIWYPITVSYTGMDRYHRRRGPWSETHTAKDLRKYLKDSIISMIDHHASIVIVGINGPENKDTDKEFKL